MQILRAVLKVDGNSTLLLSLHVSDFGFLACRAAFSFHRVRFAADSPERLYTSVINQNQPVKSQLTTGVEFLSRSDFDSLPSNCILNCSISRRWASTVARRPSRSAATLLMLVMNHFEYKTSCPTFVNSSSLSCNSVPNLTCSGLRPCSSCSRFT